MQPRPNRQLVYITLVLVAIPLIGIGLGLIYAQLPGNNPQKSQAGCESVGGDWDAVGGKCLISYKESGEPCTDGGQCKSGICSPPTLSNEQRAAFARGSISGIIGTCATTTEVTGCVPQVQKGVVSAQSMCEE